MDPNDQPAPPVWRRPVQPACFGADPGPLGRARRTGRPTRARQPGHRRRTARGRGRGRGLTPQAPIRRPRRARRHRPRPPRSPAPAPARRRATATVMAVRPAAPPMDRTVPRARTRRQRPHRPRPRTSTSHSRRWRLLTDRHRQRNRRSTTRPASRSAPERATIGRGGSSTGEGATSVAHRAVHHLLQRHALPRGRAGRRAPAASGSATRWTSPRRRPAAARCTSTPATATTCVPLVRGFADAFAGYDAVVTPSGSCAGDGPAPPPDRGGAGRRARLDDRLADRVGRRVARGCYELTEFLVDVLGVTDVGAYFPHRVTYHPTCHGLRVLGSATGRGGCSRAVRGPRPWSSCPAPTSAAASAAPSPSRTPTCRWRWAPTRSAARSATGRRRAVARPTTPA